MWILYIGVNYKPHIVNKKLTLSLISLATNTFARWFQYILYFNSSVMLYNYRGKKCRYSEFIVSRLHIKFSHLFSKLNTLGLWISLCKLWLWCTLYTAHTHITPTYIYDTYLWNVFGLSVCNLCLRRHILFFFLPPAVLLPALLQQAVIKYIVTSCARVLAYTCLKHGAVSQGTWLHFFFADFQNCFYFFSHLQGVSKSGEHGASRLSYAESVSM